MTDGIAVASTALAMRALRRAVKIGSAVWSQEMSKNRAHTKLKLKTRESNISLICPVAHTGAITFNFGMRGNIVDIIICVKLCPYRFMGFEVLTPPILPLSVGLADRTACPYNCISTAVLQCDLLLTETYVDAKMFFHSFVSL